MVWRDFGRPPRSRLPRLELEGQTPSLLERFSVRQTSSPAKIYKGRSRHGSVLQQYGNFRLKLSANSIWAREDWVELINADLIQREVWIVPPEPGCRRSERLHGELVVED